MLSATPTSNAIAKLRARDDRAIEGEIVRGDAQLAIDLAEVRRAAESAERSWPQATGAEKDDVRDALVAFRALRAHFTDARRWQSTTMLALVRRPAGVRRLTETLSSFIAAFEPLLAADDHAGETLAAALLASNPDLRERLAARRARAAAGMSADWMPSEDVSRTLSGS